MFGYLNIQKDTLEQGKQGLWQTFMCGLCMSTKHLLGNVPRMVISNDVNCFNVLFHSVANVDVQVQNKRCFSHPFKKRPILHTTELTDKLAYANVILTYWNLFDDVVDGGSSKKRAAMNALKKYYRKAQKAMPRLDEIVSTHYNELRAMEQSNSGSIDQVAHSFACLSQDFCSFVLGDLATPYVQTLCYNVGKWIYLIDALDDIAKDIAKGNYNPFVACYGAKTVADLAVHKQDVQFEMYMVLNRIAQCYNDLCLTKYTCILHNVLLQSIRDKTAKVLSKLQ